MLFILETQQFLSQTFKDLWLEMDVPTGNMILKLHTMKWLITTLYTLAIFGKVCNQTTALKNITMKIGRELMLALCVKVLEMISK
jgi:hypothetical protein